MSGAENTLAGAKSVRPSTDTLSAARSGDAHALNAMFKQFVGDEETVLESYYLGKQGILGFGRQSFGCVTDRKLASISVGFFGHMEYRDGYIEEIETGAIFQPSLFWLYILSFIVVVSTFGIGLLLLPLVTRGFYRFNKSGLVATFDVGIPAYVFANRNRLTLVNRLWRRVHAQRLALTG
ncbi:MAG: hypothetical protein AAGL69_13275 [Pseudomonadota bacterium]